MSWKYANNHLIPSIYLHKHVLYKYRIKSCTKVWLCVLFIYPVVLAIYKSTSIRCAMHRLYYEQVSESCNHLSQILLYFMGHLLLVYMKFLYGKVLFISALHSENLGGKGLIHFLAITFHTENIVSCKNVLVYLSIESGSIPRRHDLGSSVAGEPILLCKNIITCAHSPRILGHDHNKWINVPVSFPHIGHRVDWELLYLATLRGVRYAWWSI